MKCKRCKNTVNSSRSRVLCTKCLESGKIRSERHRINSNLKEKRSFLGRLSVQSGKCKSCYTKDIFWEHSKKYCKNCFRSRQKANAKYRKLHGQIIVQRNSTYLQKNPEKKTSNYHTRRSREIGAIGKFSDLEWKNLKNLYKERCLWCREPRKLTADHVIPLSRGGSNWITNIQPLCRRCNSKKGTKIIDFRPFGSMIMDWT